MNVTSFFEALAQHHKNNLPFVVYRKPNSSTISCWLQKDVQLHKTNTFTESGFVFAPFNLEEESILFPKSDCVFSEINDAILDVENFEISEIIHDEKQKKQHLSLVSKGVENIKSNAFKKVVLSRCETKTLQANNPLTIFKRLHNKYKNAMVYCWFHPKVGLWIGATPELLFKVEGKQLTTMSLAGTKPYNADEPVKWTPKELEEQQIVTDFIAKQIKPYTNTVNISDVVTVKAGSLLHLKTKITSVIKDEMDLKAIIKALHPTPAVCGFPKAEAKDFILKNEHYNREYYSGFLGELNLKQAKTRNTNRRNVENNAYAVIKTQSNFYVNLRCMQLNKNTANIYVGGGITKASNPLDEWDETVNKTATINTVLS